MKIYTALLALLTTGFAPAAVVINEFEPNPVGSDPATVNFEISGGIPSATFDLWVVSIESDTGGGAGTVDRAANITGTYTANGIGVATMPDLENPSFTIVLTDAFTGSVGIDYDASDDGTFDDPSIFGTILDVIAITDTSSATEPLYGANLGGIDLGYSGDEPKLVFRDGTTGDWYAVNDQGNVPEEVHDVNGALVTVGFDADPESTTFGSVNPSQIPEPATSLLGALGLIALLRRKR